MAYEAPKVTVEVDGRRLRLSSLEKVMYPAHRHDQGARCSTTTRASRR